MPNAVAPITQVTAKTHADHALALVVPGGAAHEDPGLVEQPHAHQAEQQAGHQPGEGDEDAGADASRSRP